MSTVGPVRYARLDLNTPPPTKEGTDSVVLCCKSLFRMWQWILWCLLTKGNGGYRYLLTYLCLAKKWLQAVPLQTITACSVAEKLWFIFSRTSIMDRILTDQGKLFCSRLIDELCSLLHVDKAKIFPYHPLSILENCKKVKQD